MINSYDVFMDGKAVGTASLEKEGLYWKIHCCCDIPADAPYQVTLKAGEEIDMGILVREHNGFCLTKRIAMKRIGGAQPSFVVGPRVAKTQERFEPIAQNEPFAYIEKIRDSQLKEKNGEIGIMIAEEDPQPQIPDSDPIREYPDEFEPEQSDRLDP